MSALRPTATTAALCATLMLVAGCQSDGNNSEAQPLPPAESESSTSPSETSSSGPSETESTEPAWQDKYSQKQIAAYEEAYDRFDTYEQRSEPIWRRGKVTPGAEELFQEYFPSPVWQSYAARLSDYEEVDVQVAGSPEVLWSKAQQISTTGRSVTLVQCVDFTTVKTTQYGKPVKRAKPFREPVIRTVQLEKPQKFNWLIYRINEPTVKNYRQCAKDDLS